MATGVERIIRRKEGFVRGESGISWLVEYKEKSRSINNLWSFVKIRMMFARLLVS